MDGLYIALAVSFVEGEEEEEEDEEVERNRHGEVQLWNVASGKCEGRLQYREVRIVPHGCCS